ncbi:MAG: hypothetical protein HY880_00925 [Deltaproteobacteria bacterium]|nr:hypothetical protein [Deltaproteobacteria bacterium]
MRFTNNAAGIASFMGAEAVQWSDWEDYDTSKAWTLSAGDGNKTVTVEFKDKAGNVAQADDDIGLIEGPDLVAEVTAPAMVQTGTEADITATVFNRGGKPAVKQSIVDFYVSKDKSLSNDDKFVKWEFVEPLGDGVGQFYSRKVLVPKGVNAGTYYIIVKVDVNDTVDESIESNNTTVSDAIVVISGVDLVIEKVDGPATAIPGETVNVEVKVANTGPGATGPFHVGLFLDNVNTWLAGWNFNIGLDGNSSYEGTMSVRLPNKLPGDYLLLAMADNTGAVTETNETNNTKTDPIKFVKEGSADLAFLALTVPANAKLNTNIDIDFTLKNNGNVAIVDDFFVDFYLVEDGLEIAYLGYYPIWLWEPFGAGEEYTGTQRLRIPFDDEWGDPIVSGNYYVTGYIDMDDLIPEAREDNNIMDSNDMAITPGVDFTADPPVFPMGAGPYLAGQPFLVQTIVNNAGPVQSDRLFVEYYLSVDNQLPVPQDAVGGRDCNDQNMMFLGRDCNIGYRPIFGGIPPYGSDFDQRWMTIPQEVPTGQYYVIIKADEPSETWEVNEGNNVGVSAAPIFITGQP